MTINIAYMANIQSQVRCHHTLIMTLTYYGMIINIALSKRENEIARNN